MPRGLIWHPSPATLFPCVFHGGGPETMQLVAAFWGVACRKLPLVCYNIPMTIRHKTEPREGPRITLECCISERETAIQCSGGLAGGGRVTLDVPESHIGALAALMALRRLPLIVDIRVAGSDTYASPSTGEDAASQIEDTRNLSVVTDDSWAAECGVSTTGDGDTGPDGVAGHHGHVGPRAGRTTGRPAWATGARGRPGRLKHGRQRC